MHRMPSTGADEEKQVGNRCQPSTWVDGEKQDSMANPGEPSTLEDGGSLLEGEQQATE